MRLLVVFWFGLLLVALAVQWASKGDLRKLKRHAVVTTGKIIAVQPEQHQTVRYEYKVGEESFVKLGGVGLIGKSLGEMSVGDSVPVYYFPENPHISRIGDPRLLSTDWKTTLLSSVCFATGSVLLFSLVRLLKKNNSYLPEKSASSESR